MMLHQNRTETDNGKNFSLMPFINEHVHHLELWMATCVYLKIDCLQTLQSLQVVIVDKVCSPFWYAIRGVTVPSRYILTKSTYMKACESKERTVSSHMDKNDRSREKLLQKIVPDSCFDDSIESRSKKTSCASNYSLQYFFYLSNRISERSSILILEIATGTVKKGCRKK